MVNSLRAWSGLVLFVFVVGHFTNHALGIVSVEAMASGERWFIDPWRTTPGTAVFLSALVVHASIALRALWLRTGTKRPVWEWTQLVLGLLIPVLLASHVAGTRLVHEFSDFDRGYNAILTVYWRLAPDLGILQAVAVVVVWTHACIGLHTWLRLKPWYGRVRAAGFTVAVMLPTLALAGYVAGGMEVRELSMLQPWLTEQIRAAGLDRAEVGALVADTQFWTRTAVAAAVVGLVGGRLVWLRRHNATRRAKVLYAPGERTIAVNPGDTLLDAIRRAGIRHASVCGGRGRCSTCRVRIERGDDALPSPADQERKTLDRVRAPSGVRLACQIHPTADMAVAALVKTDAGPGEDDAKTSDDHGHEVDAAFLFVDLRGSTRLSEQRLPFDVVFILNRFFAELSLALEETGGHYAQFNGDGLMAIYGLDSPPDASARAALAGAQRMFERVETLNRRLSDELSEPLRIGIGIHAGEAIVGKMGPPQSPIVSALGDTVNVAARLESLTKEFGEPLVISAEVARRAGLDTTAHAHHTVAVKGRDGGMEVIALPSAQPSQTASDLSTAG